MGENANPQLTQAIREGDLSLTRSVIIGLAATDLDEAKQAYQDALRELPAIVQAHDDFYPIDTDHASWTESYWHGITRDLMRNFSKERFEHLCQVGAHVFTARIIPPNIKLMEGERQSRSTTSTPPGRSCLVYVMFAIGMLICFPLVIWNLIKRY